MNVSIGMKAPDFKAMSSFGPICLSDYRGSWVILFSHPGDFTPVCTTEFIAFTEAYEEFEKLNTKLIGLSIDSNPSHLAWVYEIYKKTGIQIPFPIIADRMAEVANLYGMIAPDVSMEKTVRNVYFIDPNQVIRAILIYPLSNGRNIYEILRLLVAMQTTDQYNVSTPANWMPYDPAIVPSPNTYKGLLERVKYSEEQGLDCLSWFLCYKNLDC